MKKNKNKKYILVIIILMILLLIVSIIYFIKYFKIEIELDILDKTWYKYNYTNGTYDILNITNNKITYKHSGDYNSCEKYTYDKKNKTINTDCDIVIKIKDINSDKLSLNINGIDYLFYDGIEETLNYEFETYYGKSISEYEKEMKRVKEISKIGYNSLFENIDSNETFKLFIYGSNCSDVSCVLALDVMEQLLSTSNNIYYMNLDEYTDEMFINLNKLISNISIDKESYNSIYPYVIIISNKQVIDEYEVKCKGFDCSKYLNNEY